MRRIRSQELAIDRPRPPVVARQHQMVGLLERGPQKFSAGRFGERLRDVFPLAPPARRRQPPDRPVRPGLFLGPAGAHRSRWCSDSDRAPPADSRRCRARPASTENRSPASSETPRDTRPPPLPPPAETSPSRARTDSRAAGGPGSRRARPANAGATAAARPADASRLRCPAPWSPDAPENIPPGARDAPARSSRRRPGARSTFPARASTRG